jgi:L-ascorbate metabolism protein UlaG (beta-lactamase superfamily)
MIQVTWTGAAGLRFDRDDRTILIEPYHTRVGILKSAVGPIVPDREAINAALPASKKISAIIVSHTHFDHALDVPLLATRCDGKIVGSHSLETLMALGGLPGRTTVCAGGETVPLARKASVTMVRSAHGLVAMGKVPFAGEIRPSNTLPMKAGGYRVGSVFAPKLVFQERTCLHIGSANFIASELEGHLCDVLFLCVPGWKKIKGYPEQVIDLTRPETIVLIHYDDFSTPHVKGAATKRLPFVDLEGMVRAIRAHAPGINLIVPEVGESIAL